MPTETVKIPSFMGGVSTQPDSNRFVNQIEDGRNLILSQARGAEKRPGTEAVQSGDTADGSLDLDNPTNSHVFHWIDRDDGEQHLLAIDVDTTTNSECLQMFDIDGTKQTVSSVTTAMRDYVQHNAASNPAASIRVITSGDTTLILNRKKKPQFDTSGDAAMPYSPLTTVTTYGGSTADGSDTMDLPPTDAVGTKFLTQQDDLGHPAGYYQVRHLTEHPYYERVRAEAAESEIDQETMPLKLTGDGAGTWTAAWIDWAPRYSGDSFTNEAPTFLQNGGTRIKDIGFHRNRFWIAAGEYVASSQAGDFWNLWNYSSTNVGEADPVELTVATDQVNEVDFFIPFNKALFVMSRGNRQFELRSAEEMSPRTATMLPSTSYATSRKARPEVTGSNLYFATDRTGTGQVMEYLYDDDGTRSIADDITAHCDGFLTGQILQLETAENVGMLFARTSDADALYVYNQFWRGQDKLQSAWNRWDFASGDELLGMKVYEDVLYLLVKNDSKIWLMKVAIGDPANDAGMGMALRIDRRLTNTGVYSSGTNETTWTLPFKDVAVDEVILSGDWSPEGKVGTRLVTTNDSTGAQTTLTISGDYSAYSAWVGRSYNGDVDLTTPYVRNDEGDVIEGVFQMKRIVVRHANTGAYDVLITPFGREQITKRFTANRPGHSGWQTGTAAIDESGYFNPKLFSSNVGTTIKLRNSTPWPSYWLDAEVRGSFRAGKTSITGN